VGGLIGFALMAAAVFVLGIASGTGTGGAIGIGLFCGFWGGLGFGGMLGATVALVREQQRQDEAG
jgi:hypothetical protein